MKKLFPVLLLLLTLFLTACAGKVTNITNYLVNTDENYVFYFATGEIYSSESKNESVFVVMQITKENVYFIFWQENKTLPLTQSNYTSIKLSDNSENTEIFSVKTENTENKTVLTVSDSSALIEFLKNKTEIKCVFNSSSETSIIFTLDITGFTVLYSKLD